MSKLHILPIIAATTIPLAIIAGCSRPQKEADHANLPEEVKPVATAILTDSASSFASTVNYPLSRPYPLHDIKDSTEMVEYYPILVDDSLKTKIKNSPDSLWKKDGWAGWTLENGSYLWIDEKMVYQVNYISVRESELLDSLRHEEISSLEPSMQEGWVPELCIIDSISGEVFRIDSDKTSAPPRFRLAGYAAGIDLSGEPSIMLYGYLDTEGTMENRYYHFRDSVGTTAEYSPDITSDDEQTPEIHIMKHGKSHRYKVRPGYWLDHIKHLKEIRSDSTVTVKPDSIK